MKPKPVGLPDRSHITTTPMLRISIAVFLIVLVGTIFGFGSSLAAGALPTAKILFYVFLSLIVLTLLLGPTLFRKR